MSAILDPATILLDRIIPLLQANTDLDGLQILKPEAQDQIRTPFIRLQGEVQGPAPGWEGSANSGVWTVYGWVSVITARADSPEGDLRRYEAAVRDCLFAEHQAGYANLTDADFKVWQIEFEPAEYQQDDTHDARALPFRCHCAVFTD